MDVRGVAHELDLTRYARTNKCSPIAAARVPGLPEVASNELADAGCRVGGSPHGAQGARLLRDAGAQQRPRTRRWDGEFESGFLQRRVCKTLVPGWGGVSADPRLARPAGCAGSGARHGRLPDDSA